MAEKKYLDLNGLGYTIRKMDSKKADVESPALTGTPTAPTAEKGTSTTQIATTEFVNDAISTAEKGSVVTVTPSRNSGEKIADITVDNTTKSLYISSNYLDKSYSGENKLSGKVTVGSCSTNVNNAYLHQRNVSSYNGIVSGTPYVGACFAINSDGSAGFFHKTYSDANGNGARNSAILRFFGVRDKEGGKLQFGTNATGNVAESDYKTVAMIDDIPNYTAGNGITIENNVISATGGSPTPIPYVTPEMFGAVGDGETDDTIAFQRMADSNENIVVFVKMVKLQIEAEEAEHKESTYAIGFDTECYTSREDEEEWEDDE
ncbi:unnamed protein product [Cylicocyclus nassatus]|uniref:Uncharacterized protein n=1 Tax=Cylicocyclus nassatus TaxID=53992 RepID=A0AA36DR59_CYLNA|nr:unnamed protein product [Cylicocyclus nassatus]